MEPKDKDKDQTEQEDKGFAVHDKRRIGKEDEPGAESASTDDRSEKAPAHEDSTGGPETATPATEGTISGEEAGQTPRGEQPETETPPRSGERTYIPLTFTSFVMSLSTSALMYLGQIPEPGSGKTVTDLVGARQTIDLISLLKEKTKGNLTSEEESFIDAVLYDLRILFVKAKT